MAAASPPHDARRPPVLLPRPLAFHFDDALSERFRLIKPWEQTFSPPLTLPDYVAALAEPVAAVLCSAGALLDACAIATLPDLRCIVTTSVGVDHIDLIECRRRGIMVAGAGTLFSEDVADVAVGMLLDVLRSISAADRWVRRGLWPTCGDFALGSKLGGKRVGILGLGSIGSAIAKRLEAFGCYISYHSRTRTAVSYPYHSTAIELAQHSEVLIVACELNSETHHIVNKDVLIALGMHGIVINIGRGPLIDERELVRFLKEGKLRGAGLDVFENEPDVPVDLFEMDNVVLSPHAAVFTSESTSKLCELLIGNLEAFFSNRSLLTPILE